MPSPRRRRGCSSVFRDIRRRRQGTATVTPDDPLIAVQDAFARNVVVGTVLRRLERLHLNTLEDAAVVQEWAARFTCPKCEEDADLQGDHIRHHLRHWLVASGTPAKVPAPAAPVRANLRFASDLLGLSRDERAILLFLLAANHGGRLREVLDTFGELTLSSAAGILAAATGLPLARILKALRSDGRLLASGLVVLDQDRASLASKVYLKPQLLELLLIPGLDRERFIRAFLEPAAPPTLDRAAYADQTSFEVALQLLRGALRTGARGVNILLWGPTGVGKSELARLFGQALGAPLYAVGRSDDAGDSATPMERLTSLRLALQVVPQQALLFFDEMEDLFRWDLDLMSASRAGPTMSKQWFGSLLEENGAPIIWCTNRVDGVDPAFLRRFSYAIELKSPGARQRADALARHAGDDLARPEVDAIAQRFDASPAQLGTAVRGARLLSLEGRAGRGAVEQVLAPVHRLVSGTDARLKPVFEPGGFRLDALHCGEDLTALAEQLAAFRDGPGPGVSLCLYGPPGTGKSEYVKYLAWRCDRPLVYRRVSDLVSCYVGQTERNIARAFDEARLDGAVLLFDEADSFLRDRKSAVRSWEVTEVNEFLQQLEAFPGIVACTTNLWRDIDEAALRRFVFKLELRYPAPAQVVRLFEAFFPEAFRAASEASVEAALHCFTTLAPGDFAAVARRVRALRADPDLAALTQMLAGEVAVKREAPVRSVGFGV